MLRPMRFSLPKALSLPLTIPVRLILPGFLVLAALLSLLVATVAASFVERRSAEGVAKAVADAGEGWADVLADGLQITLAGTAPTEADRFRALTAAGTVVDSDRVIDAMDVLDPAALKAPDFTIEILRNGDGVSLIGLVPAATDRDGIVTRLTAIAGEGRVTDMLETADHPVPQGWPAALDFGMKAIGSLPRSKVSIFSDHVAITAISDSAAEKARIEADLSRKAPKGLRLLLDISAPRPVITPFTLRFLIDESGARFDACSADSSQARDRILAAATAAGATRKNACTIGLGVPTPAWADAVTMGLAAMQELGAGSITFSDADISLIAADTVTQDVFDRVVGELESNLPEVFSLHAVLTPKQAETKDAPVVPEFVAKLSSEGRLEMRGRLGDELSRDAVDSFARARFGSDSVHAATRLAPDVPAGWPMRVLAALEALGELDSGSAQVRPEIIRISGVTGSATASDSVARILSSRLGEGLNFKLDIRYDERLDPLLGLPTDEECVAGINDLLTEHKINFEPGSAQIARDASGTLDKVAEKMKQCSDFAMEVGGHTDAQGREEMNLELSQKRAEAVVAALMERRVLTGNLTARGYGETVPIGDNETEAGREANRRIEFRLIKPAAVAAAAEGGAEEAPVVVNAPDDDTPKPKPRPER
jgi:OOP family OmpA-OmpF porin